MSLAARAKILRVLEERRIRRLGGDREFETLEEGDTRKSLSFLSYENSGIFLLAIALGFSFWVVVEHIHYDAQSRQRNIEIHAYPVLDAEGRLGQMIEYGLDVTEEKRRSNTSDGQVVLEGEDNGTGISEIDRQQLFDPFFTTKPEGEGTGLGLSISYAIVRDHDGQLECQSREGEGAIFRVLLPSLKPEELQPIERE